MKIDADFLPPPHAPLYFYVFFPRLEIKWKTFNGLLSLRHTLVLFLPFYRRNSIETAEMSVKKECEWNIHFENYVRKRRGKTHNFSRKRWRDIFFAGLEVGKTNSPLFLAVHDTTQWKLKQNKANCSTATRDGSVASGWETHPLRKKKLNLVLYCSRRRKAGNWRSMLNVEENSLGGIKRVSVGNWLKNAGW